MQLYEKQHDSTDERCIAKKKKERKTYERNSGEVPPIGLFHRNGSDQHFRDTDLFNAALVETPLAPSFQDYMSENNLVELSVELLHIKPYKSHPEASYKFCKNHGEVTVEITCPILEFEAARGVSIITFNSFGTEPSKGDQETLYPTYGKLCLEGWCLWAQAEDFHQVRRVADHYSGPAFV